MTMAEQGIYFHMLCLQWVQKDCALPGDMKTICNMLNTKSIKKVSKILQKCFKFDSNLYRNERLYNEYLKAKRLHDRACKAAKKRWNEDTKAQNKHQTSINSSIEQAPENQNQNQNQNKDLKDIGRKKAAPFSPPTIEAVTAYCQERKNKVDPQKFIDHYTSNGWRVGKTPMKNWQAAVRTWEKSDFGGNGNGHKDARSFFERDVEQREEAKRGARVLLGICGGGPGVDTYVHPSEVDRSRKGAIPGEAVAISKVEADETG